MKMNRTEMVLTCINCGATHLIRPPNRKLKKTTEIELNCYRCNFKNNYKYTYKLKHLIRN